jgi:hypothetical protein
LNEITIDIYIEENMLRNSSTKKICNSLFKSNLFTQATSFSPKRQYSGSDPLFSARWTGNYGVSCYLLGIACGYWLGVTDGVKINAEKEQNNDIETPRLKNN